MLHRRPEFRVPGPLINKTPGTLPSLFSAHIPQLTHVHRWSVEVVLYFTHALAGCASGPSTWSRSGYLRLIRYPVWCLARKQHHWS